VWYWWIDNPNNAFFPGNGNGMVDITEVYWRYYGQRTLNQIWDAGGNLIADPDQAYLWDFSGFDWRNPQAKVDPYETYLENPGPMRTHEVILSVERELLPDFGVAIDFSYRKFGNWSWTRSWDGANEATLDGRHNYVIAGQVPTMTTPWSSGDAGGRDYWLRSPNYTSYQFSATEKRPNSYYNRTYMSVDLRFNKRLSDRWMFNGSVTLQDQKIHYDETDIFPFNPTNLWAINDNIYAPGMGGGSGKITMQVFSAWLLKLSGLYQLPLDFNVSFTFNARQGHPIPRGYTLIDESSPNPAFQSVWVYSEKFGTDRLPTFWNLNFRIEKIIRAGDFGRIYLMCDIFNVFNNSMMNRRYDYDYGEYYVDDGFFWSDPYFGLANEVLNPRIFRFGIRFQF
jgi:hypothetical protein